MFTQISISLSFTKSQWFSFSTDTQNKEDSNYFAARLRNIRIFDFRSHALAREDTLYNTPGILTSLHHFVANADLLCAANNGKR